MNFNLILLGNLSTDIAFNSLVLNESWLPVNASMLMIGREIVDISDAGVLIRRGKFKSTISYHPVGTEVYLLSVDVPVVETVAALNSELYPFSNEDVSINTVALSAIDFIENNYTYGSLVSLSYPVETGLSDSVNSSVSATVVALPAPNINEDDGTVAFAVTSITKNTVVKRGYEENEDVGTVAFAVTSIVKANTVIRGYATDGTGIDAVLVSGSMAVTAIDTAGTDGTGIDAVLVSGSLA